MTCNLHPRARRGIELFNSGEYFAAHEALEDAWRAEAPGALRDLYQGILQIAVCYFHLLRGNHAGALRMAARALRHLTPLPALDCNLNVTALRADLQTVTAALVCLGPESTARFDRRLLKPIEIK